MDSLLLTKPLSRRNKYIMFDAEQLIQFFRRDLNDCGPDKWITSHGIPDDAKVVGVHISHWPTTPYRFAVVLESESFPEVDHGKEIPELTLSFRRHVSHREDRDAPPGW